jgi:L-ribulose-5-phosphate 3-epimerase
MMPLAAITDEFSPDLDVALDAMTRVGMTGAELRVVGDRNLIQFSDDEVDRVRATVEARGMRVISIASPVLKCVLPDAPSIDTRFQQDVFGSSFTMADQPRLEKRALEIAERTGARIVRVFSYWRTVDPDACFDRVCEALRRLATTASERGITIGIENEPACNIATGAETARVMAAVDHPNLQVIWDPANALVAGETPFPDGYRSLPPARIVHVHAKDCTVSGQTPTWGAVGEMAVDWKGQLRALVADGYTGWLSLETHWKGPRGDKMEASTICGRNMQKLASEAGARP